MRITIPMPSRNRPAGLLSVITSLDALATGSNEITYAIMLDSDDTDSRLMVKQWADLNWLPKNTHTIVGERDKTLNARMNEVIGAFAAEVYCCLPDDGFPLTQGWDAIFVGLYQQGIPAFAWQEKNDPGNPTFIAITERWRVATGKMFTEYFPFWFADTWIAEVHALAFAKGLGIVNQLQMGGKRGKTHGMRDLDFWFRFFAATRVERIAEAEAVAKEYGFTLNVERDRGEIMEAMETADEKQLRRVPEYESMFGSHEDPETPLYAECKAKAKQWIADNDKRIVIPPNTILRPH